MGERNTEKMLLVGSSKDIFQQVRKEQKDFGKEKKKSNTLQWKYEGVTWKEKENGKHRLTGGSEKTARGGECGRAGPRPLRLERQVQGENETQRHEGMGPVKLGASGTRAPSRQPSSC